MGFSEMNSQKKRPISREFGGKIRDKFCQKTIVKKANFADIAKPVSLQSNWFCADFTNVSNETKWQFCQFFLGGGEGGNDER